MKGEVLAVEYRKGLENPLLTQEESQLAAMQAIIRMNSRKTLENKLGRPIYSFTEYEKVLRATILIDVSKSKGIGAEEESISIVSIDKECPDPYSVITKKILPHIEKVVSELDSTTRNG